MLVRTFTITLAAFVLGLTLSLALATPAQACPFCAEQVHQKGQDGKTGNPSAAYNYSIFAMIGIVGVVLLAMGRLCYVVVKQADADSLASIPADALQTVTPPAAPPSATMHAPADGAKPAVTA
ncbi:MAG TPA: hypothetical protein VL860_12930 [Planctomycetota bacterium]|nr:hypothetical protein [Planctomycetota bacterium]